MFSFKKKMYQYENDSLLKKIVRNLSKSLR